MLFENSAYKDVSSNIVQFIERIGSLLEVEKCVFRSESFVVREFKAQKDLHASCESLLDSSSYCMFLLDGFACSYRLANTGKKQIVALHTPGSFCDLAGAYLGASGFNVATVTPATVVFMPSDLLVRWGQHYAGLGRLLSRITLIEASVSREWLVNVGHRSAFQRTAHLLCELAARLQAAGSASGPHYPLPLTQLDLADALGLTPVHLSRALQWLRAEGLIELTGDRLTIPSWPELADAGDFDPGYLRLAGATSRHGVGTLH